MAPVAVLNSSLEVQANAPSKHDPNAGFGEAMHSFGPPTFEDKEQERQYLKERLTASIRLFGKHGFDHHVVSLFSNNL